MIAVLGAVIIATIVWIIPFWWYDLGVNILTDAAFTIFTIVFLTWLIRSRENGQWKLVEKEVNRRTSRHLTEILGEIENTFFSRYRILVEKGRIEEGQQWLMPLEPLLLEVYAQEEPKKLGSSWQELMSAPNAEERIRTQIASFQSHQEYLEHVVSEYSRFLPANFMHSLMQVQNWIDYLTKYLSIMIADFRVWDVAQKHEYVFEERFLRPACTIIKELIELNKRKQLFLWALPDLWYSNVISFDLERAAHDYDKKQDKR